MYGETGVRSGFNRPTFKSYNKLYKKKLSILFTYSLLYIYYSDMTNVLNH
jgi:hypothetical protein